MVKVTHKINQGATLRQATRLNISKKVNLRQPLAKNNSNPHININKFFLNQGFRQINSTNINLTPQNIDTTPQGIDTAPQGIDTAPQGIDTASQDIDTPIVQQNDIQYITQGESFAMNHFQEYSFDQDDNISDNNQENYYNQENYINQDNLNQEEYENSDDEDISFVFKNKYDGFRNVPPYHGEAKPYFPNKSVMLMFIWCTKHMIGSHAYQDLVKILQHPDFYASNLPLSITTLKNMRLMTLNSHNVTINPMDTPSTSASFKEGYTFSILDYIQRIINNPSIYKELYFGPGIEASERLELWHGQIWKESSLFGETSCTIGNVLYKSGDFILYDVWNESTVNQHLGQINGIVISEKNSKEKLLYVQKILYYTDLPGNIKSSARLNQSNNYTVWLTEDREIVHTNNVIRCVNIWLEDLPVPTNYDYRISEILYIHNNRAKIRPINKRHYQLPYQHNINQNSSNLRHLKFFIDLYFDDFGAFGKAYHKLGGLYIQLGNMPLLMRQHLKNHFLIGLIPFGAKFEDFIKPFICQMQKLQEGIIMTDYYGEKVFISGGLGMCTADLPQGNDMAGVRRHNADLGCHSCEITQENLNNMQFDIQANSRYCHIMDLYFQEIKQASTKSAKENIAKQHGLCLKKNILDHLIRNRYKQVPQDPYHCLAGLVCRLFDETFRVMNDDGHKEFVKFWHAFEIPSIWNRLQNPITHRDSYWMNDSLRLTMIMPFILIRAINHKHYKTEFINKIRDKYSLGNRTQVPNIIVDCWVKMAKTCKAVFKAPYIVTSNYNDYTLLKKKLEQVTEILLKVFGETFLSLPNLHILRHLPEIAINFGTLINTSVFTKEAVHGLYKRVILHTNKKDISMDLSRRDNTLQTVRYLLDGGLDSRYNEVNNLFTNIAYDTSLYKLFDGWYIGTSVNTKEENINISEISSNHSNFQNIQVRGLWKSSKIQNQGLSATLSAENLLTEFTRVYKELYNNNGIIIQRHINYYDSIQFIVRSKTDSYTNIILRVGEAIDVEDIDSLGERSYALIRAIITHKDDYGRINPFLLVNWFYKNGNVDPATGLPIYCLQESDDNLWFHLHPLIIVDQQPRVHFVHRCTGLCSEGLHNKNNMEYILNEFYYLIM